MADALCACFGADGDGRWGGEAGVCVGSGWFRLILWDVGREEGRVCVGLDWWRIDGTAVGRS